MKVLQMNFIEKINQITLILDSLSAPKSRKRPYDLKTIAIALYIHWKTGIPLTKISLWGTVYHRKNFDTIYIYWLRKLKDSGKLQEIINFI